MFVNVKFEINKIISHKLERTINSVELSLVSSILAWYIVQ